MIAHTLLTVLASLALVPVAGMGPAYWLTAIILGIVFIRQVWGVTGGRRQPKATFRFSIWYLTTLFAAVAIDGLFFR